MRLKQKFASVLLVASLLVPLMPSQVLAATGLIYITPGSSSLQVGDSETLSLRITPGTTVDGVQATISYNAGALQLNSVDTSASPFTVQLQKSAGGGTITLSLGNLSGGVSSDALIANMNFTALAAGSASLTLSNVNATSAGAYTNPASSGASISLTAPVGGSGGGGSSGGSASSQPSGGSTKIRSTTSSAAAATGPAAAAPAAQPTAPPAKISVKLSKISLTSALIGLTADQSLNMYVLYGTDPSQLTLKTAAVSNAKANITIGQGAALVPGTTYYYQVVGEDAAGNVTKLPVEHFTTSGYTVRVTVLDSRNKVLANTRVTLHTQPQTAMTDANGVATFTGVAPGLHHLEYAVSGKSYSAIVYVADQAGQGQTAAVVLPVEQANQSSWSGLSASLFVVISLLTFLLSVEIFRHSARFKQEALKLVASGRALV